MDFNKIEAEERHIFKLWTLCRVCGQAGEKLQYCLDNYGDLLNELYCIDLTNDDPAVHPQMVCQTCRVILQNYLKKNKSKSKGRLPPLPDLYTFHRHDSTCDVCDRASGLLPKRKLSVDFGQNVSPAKLARQEGDQPTELPEGDAGAEVQEQGETQDQVAPQESSRDNVLLEAIQNTIGDDAVASSEEILDHPEQEGFTKYVYLNMIRRFKARGVKEEKALDSIEVDRFTQKNFASTFLTCSLCKRLPLKPVTTECKHVFCEACISDWLNFGNVCPKCEEVIVELSDASQQLNHLYMLLDAPCSFASKGCEVKLTPFEIRPHEADCPYNIKEDSPSSSSEEEEEQEQVDQVEEVPKVTPRKRKSLRFVTHRIAASRVKDLSDYISKTCKEEREDKIDFLFCMLREALVSAGDARSKNIDLLWRNKRPILPPRKTRQLPPPLQRQVPNRRKGTPRKRGRQKLINTPEEEEFANSDQEEEEEEQDEDLEKDETWTPRAAIGRKQIKQDSEPVEEKDAEEEEAPKEDSQKTNETGDAEMDTAVQEIIGTNNVVMHVVLEGNQQSVDSDSVIVQ